MSTYRACPVHGHELEELPSGDLLCAQGEHATTRWNVVNGITGKVQYRNVSEENGAGEPPAEGDGMAKKATMGQQATAAAMAAAPKQRKVEDQVRLIDSAGNRLTLKLLATKKPGWPYKATAAHKKAGDGKKGPGDNGTVAWFQGPEEAQDGWKRVRDDAHAAGWRPEPPPAPKRPATTFAIPKAARG